MTSVKALPLYKRVGHLGRWMAQTAFDRTRLQSLYLTLLVLISLLFALLQENFYVREACLVHALLVTALLPVVRRPALRSLATNHRCRG